MSDRTIATLKARIAELEAEVTALRRDTATAEGIIARAIGRWAPCYGPDFAEDFEAWERECTAT